MGQGEVCAITLVQEEDAALARGTLLLSSLQSEQGLVTKPVVKHGVTYRVWRFFISLSPRAFSFFLNQSPTQWSLESRV